MRSSTKSIHSSPGSKSRRGILVVDDSIIITHAIISHVVLCVEPINVCSVVLPTREDNSTVYVL